MKNLEREKNLRMKMLRVALAVLTGTATSLPPPPSCSHLQHAYAARGVPRDAVPKTPVPGNFCLFGFFSCRVQQCRGGVSLVRQIGFFLSSSFGKAKEGGEVDQKCAQEICPIFHPCQNPPLHTTLYTLDIKVSGGDLNLIPKHASSLLSRLSLRVLTQSLAYPSHAIYKTTHS